MTKKNTPRHLNPFIYILAPTIVAGYFIIFQLIQYLNFGGSITSLSVSHPLDLPKPQFDLTQEQPLRFSFDSKHQHIGQVALRFSTHLRINDDLLTFRIKEAGQQSWYYQAEYKTDQFQPEELFPFGFPVIADSVNKTYEVEILSQRSDFNNYVSLSRRLPVLVTRHQFDKATLLANPYQLNYFILQKIVHGDPRQLLNLILLISITAFYFLSLKVVRLFRLLPLLLLTAVGLDIVFINFHSDALYLVFITLWLTTSNLQTPKPTYASEFTLSLYLLATTGVFTLLQLYDLADKATVWFYLFLTIACWRFFYTLGRRRFHHD